MQLLINSADSFIWLKSEVEAWLQARIAQSRPHGLANALLLTAVIRFNAGDPRAAKRYARLGIRKRANYARPVTDNANDTARNA
ncbi:hypothetical protein QM042_12600 [Escherichia coli]|uniref:hypothetical protein n=1 Tax=Escherichia coli TaxID=562 RepID=UPI0039882679